MSPFLVYVSNRQVRNAFSIFTFPPTLSTVYQILLGKNKTPKSHSGPTQDMFLCRKPVSLCILTTSKTSSFPRQFILHSYHPPKVFSRPQLFLLSSPLLLVENAQMISETTGQCVWSPAWLGLSYSTAWSRSTGFRTSLNNLARTHLKKERQEYQIWWLLNISTVEVGVQPWILH